MIHARVLGPVDITVDGDEAPSELRWRKHTALTVYLARSPEGRRTREHLIGLLWPERTEKAARQSLREALKVIRKCVGADLVVTDGERVCLEPGAVTLDLDAVASLAADGAYADAASGIRGDFMEGFSVPDASEFDDWLTAERTEWRRRSVDILLGAARNAERGGDLGAAAEWASRALGLESGSDAAVQIAMRCLAVGGNRSAALRAYETFLATLDDLGTAPQADTQALADRVREARVWRRTTPTPSASTDTRRPPLVGRANPLRQVLDVWEACRKGPRAVAVVVEGDPGTGKSRLADELTLRARLDGATVSTVRAAPADRDERWSGLVGILEGGLLSAPGVTGVDPTTVAAFAAMSTAWADHFHVTPEGDGGAALTRAVRDTLRVIAEEGPIVIVVDDAHWCDGDTLLALDAALAKLAALPVCLWLNTVAAHRRDEIDSMRARLGRELTGVAVDVGPLDADGVRALCAWANPDLTGERLDRLSRRIVADSGGLPLLAVELLNAVASGLELEPGESSWPKTAQTLDDTLPSDLPDSVVGAIRVGFRRQTEDAQLVLRAVAVGGERVAAAALERATELDAEAVAAALDELEWSRWLQADARGYAFVARIVGEVVRRDMLTPGQRNRLTAKLASAG